MSIEERIRTYCKVNHIRLCDFANRIGMHTSTLSRSMNTGTIPARGSQLKAMAKELGVTLDELLEDE